MDKDTSTWHSNIYYAPGAPNDKEGEIDEAKDEP
jgi:hypothetical protein